MKIVADEEAAAVDEFAQNLALLLGQAPFARLHGVQKRPVEYFVAVFQIHALLHGAGIHSRQPPHRLQKMPVSARIILGPQRQPEVIIAR